MNKFNNPRLTNTTVSGTGVKHPMRPHVILGDPENGFIRGDLLDANAVIKLIKNAAKAIGALEELEQSNWIDDNATTVEPVNTFAGYIDQSEYCLGVVDGGEKKLVTSTGTLSGKIIIAGPDVDSGGTVGEHIDAHDFNESNNVTGSSAGFPENFPCISVANAREYEWLARQISID